MPTKKKVCIVEHCQELTHGEMCIEHSYELRKKFETTREMKRHHSLLKKYGITLEEFWVLWIIFQGRCGICNVHLKLPEQKRGQSLGVVAVDHDHKTGNLRGLLCNACNKGLGFFKDSVNSLEKAKEWVNG